MIFKKIKNNPEFAKHIKYFAIITSSALVFMYFIFLFVLPYAININNFTPQISSEINKLTGFNFELINPKFKTTWKLGIKVSADKIVLNYKDGSNFANLTYPALEINLPTLLLKHLNLDKIYAKEANIRLVFSKDKKYTLEDYITKMLPDKEQKDSSQQSLPVEIRNINIAADSVSLALEDKNLNKTFISKAENTKIGLASLNGPVKIKTAGYVGVLGSDKNFVDFKINLFAKLPPADENANKNKEPSSFKFDFNPLAGLDMFAFRSNLDVDLKLLDFGENFKAKGYINLNDVTLKINNTRLPESFALVTFNGNNAGLDSRLYLSKDEFIKTAAALNLGKKSKISVEAQSEKISLTSIKLLAQSLFNMFGIKNDFDKVSTTGLINCDFKLKSNFKSVESSGNLRLAGGSINYPKLSLNLTNISSYLDFENNKISIKDTSALVNGSKFEIGGTINSDSKLDVKIKSDPLKINDIVKLATQFGAVKSDDIKDYAFNSGTIVLSVLINGDLQNIVPKADIALNKANIYIKNLKMPISLDKAVINVEPDKKDFIAKINAVNFKAASKNPVFNISAPVCDLEANSKLLTIKPFSLNLNGTNAKIHGSVNDYMNKPDTNIIIQGAIHPDTILTFIPKNNRAYVSRSGQMPFNAKVNGGLDNLKIQANVTSNPKNYISVVDIKNIRGLENTLNADIVLKGDNLVLNSISINSKSAKIASLSGKIGKIYSNNPALSPLNVVIPQKLSLAVSALGKLSLNADANIAVTGSVNAPQISGSANISNLNYPEFQLYVANAFLDFKKSLLSVRADGIKAAGSDFAGDALVQTDFSKGIIINSLNFSSLYTDSDALMKLTASMPNTQVSAGPSVNATIKSGKGKITKLKSGTMNIENISFDFNLYKNLFKLTNINANFADGKITGEASYNISNTKVTADGLAKSVNMRKAANAFVGGSSLILSGTMNGMAKINFRGTTYEQQMRTLNGQIKFDITNGQYGEAARFERFLHAGNLLTQSLLNLNLNQTISAVTNRNTGEFKKIEGTLSLSNGWANISNFKSSGPNMSLYATGKYNILTAAADLKILGKISSTVVSVLGPLGSFSLDKMFDKLSPKGLAVLEIVKSVTPSNPLFIQINQSDLAKIPPLSASASNTTSKDFQVLINGPVTRSTSVKSFKWASNVNQTQATQP